MDIAWKLAPVIPGAAAIGLIAYFAVSSASALASLLTVFHG